MAPPSITSRRRVLLVVETSCESINGTGTADRRCSFSFNILIQQIYVLNILNIVFTLRFFLQNAVCFIILTYLVPVLFTFYIQRVLKLKRNNSGAKMLSEEGNTLQSYILYLLNINTKVQSFEIF